MTIDMVMEAISNQSPCTLRRIITDTYVFTIVLHYHDNNITNDRQ